MSVSNSLIKKTNTQPTTFSAFLSQDAIKRKINEMVGGKDGQRFITSILSVVSNNPTIAECEKSTILSSALLGEALKLSPSPQLGHYYIVPFNNTKKGIKEAQFQIGYKGYIQLAIRSGQYKNINVVSIKKGELISYNPLTEELETKFIDDDEVREQTETIGYYAMFELINGFKKSIYWSKKKMLAHADKYSQSFSLNAKKGKEAWQDKVSFADYEANREKYKDNKNYSSFWYKDFDGMAFKTLLRQLISKWGIMSIELQNAFEKDMGVIKDDGKVDYVDNEDTINTSVNIKDTEAESQKQAEIDADIAEAEAGLIAEAEYNNQQMQMAEQEQMAQQDLDLADGF